MDVLRRLSGSGAKNQIARLTLALLFGFLPAAAGAADNSLFWTFAKANADKFPSEISGPLHVGDVVTVRGRLDTIEMAYWMPPYNDSEGSVTFTGIHANLYSLQLPDVCRGEGSFTGQNAFGAKVQVRRESCERVVAFGDGSLSFAGATMKMTPGQYRTMKKSGIDVEIDFKIAPNKKGEVVTFTANTSPGTVTDPVESKVKVWMVNGQIQAARFLTPGTLQPVPVFSR
jgi:hypothetical protein